MTTYVVAGAIFLLGLSILIGAERIVDFFGPIDRARWDWLYGRDAGIPWKARRTIALWSFRLWGAAAVGFSILVFLFE